MRNLRWLGVAMVVAGCGGKAKPGEPATVPAATAATMATTAAADTAVLAVDTTAAATPETVAEPEVQAEVAAADTPETTACKALLAKAWTAVKPNVEKLGVVTDAALEGRFMANESFIKACAALPPEKRACLAKADHPLAAIATCEADKPTRTLYPFDFTNEVKLWPRVPLAKEDAAALTAWAAGTWVNEWASIGLKSTWKIDATGTVESTELKDGQPKQGALVIDSLTFRDAGRVEVHYQGSSTQTFTFVRGDNDTFYAASNTLYDAYPVADEKNFVVRHNWDFIVMRDGACEVIVQSGESLPATCRFAKEGARRVFTTEVTRPGASRPSTMRHIVQDKLFLVDSLVEIGTFKRQK